MTRFATSVLACAALLLPAPLAAQDAFLETAVEPAVRAEIAARWSIDPDDIALEWLAAPPSHAREFHALRIVGGSTGSWVVTLLDASDRPLTSLRVRIGTRREAVVAARAIERGAPIAEDDVAFTTVTHWGPPAPPAATPIGWTARRAITAGEPLVAPAVAPPDAVRAGDTISFTLDSRTVRLSTRATALGSAPLGGRVAVRLDNGRRIEGTVTGPGTVRFGTEPRS